MNILYYSWGENSKDDFINATKTLGHGINLIFAPSQNHLNNPTLENFICEAALNCKPDYIFTFNYLPIISQAAMRVGIPYISWVYDCPHWTLYSPTITNPVNRVFLFDLTMVDMVKTLGCTHTYHLPLATNFHKHNYSIGNDGYKCKISFVGNLYENNPLNQVQYMPAELMGFLDGIKDAQKQIWGYDLIQELLTPELISQIGSYIKYDNNSLCPLPDNNLFLSILQKKLTSEERISSINHLSDISEVTLYTTSNALLCPNATYKGTVSYTQEMPQVFANSEINLNITLRSIASGIPLRAIDIMGCGGFLLSNYQPELDMFFENNVDYVAFYNESDLLDKADYYLSHPNERKKIAQNGLMKVKANFSYENQLAKMFSTLIQL